MLHDSTPADLAPGDHVSGTVFLNNAKPLSISELRITLYGVVDTHIFRKYIVKFAFADWYGRGFLFQKFIVLLVGPTTLPPGQRSFKFSFQIPEATEPMEEDWKRFNKWSEQSPFLGKESPAHRLPPSKSISSKQTFGYCDGSVSYHLDATMVKGRQRTGYEMVDITTSARTRTTPDTAKTRSAS